jgi:catechol 2,3-dioxygenase-like lactoylglutathione lyase family enzyme
VTVQLDHMIVPARDKAASAAFLAEILGLPAPVPMGPFAAVALEGGPTLDFADTDGPIRPTHYAFAVSAAEFDVIFERVHRRGLSFWADPQRRRPGEVADRGRGRGFYFEDPSGHFLEVLTRAQQDQRAA